MKVSSFKTELGAEEVFFVIQDACVETSFDVRVEKLFAKLKDHLLDLKLSGDTLIFSRVYLSDIRNQQEVFLNSSLGQWVKQGAYSVIEQSPLNEHTKIILLSYHIRLPAGTVKVTAPSEVTSNGAAANEVVVKGPHYQLYFFGDIHSTSSAQSSDAETHQIFKFQIQQLKNRQMNMLNHLLRTWIYVWDVDSHYAGMVKARRELFDQEGLTSDSRYIASTGIEGRSTWKDRLISMDSLSMGGIETKQIVKMEALNNLCGTEKYGVTFERGTRVNYGDRSHFYISGTASIDENGDVLFLGNPVKQTKRTLENIRALLQPQGADLEDMAYLIVYLRDLTDRDAVMKQLQAEVKHNIPMVFVRGSVCRPEWLVEIEGVAIIPHHVDYQPFFC